jgi:hypothetical protein
VNGKCIAYVVDTDKTGNEGDEKYFPLATENPEQYKCKVDE